MLKVITPKDFEPTPISKKLLDNFAEYFKLTDYSLNSYTKGIRNLGIE